MHINLPLISRLAGHVAVAVIALTVATTVHCVMLHAPCVAFTMLAPALLSSGCAMPTELCHHRPVLAGALSVPSSVALICAILAM